MQQLKAKSADVLAQLRYDLPPTLAFHRQAYCRHCLTFLAAPLINERHGVVMPNMAAAMQQPPKLMQ